MGPIRFLFAILAGGAALLAATGAAPACCRNYQEFADDCRARDGIPSPNPQRCSPRARVDPSVSQANSVNDQGRDAMRRKDYDQAIFYFDKAYQINSQQVFLDNKNLALAGKHFELGQRAFEQEKWELAVAEYQRSLTFRDDPAARDNIRAARYNQALGNARAARGNKNYDLVILYYQEARKWAKDRSKVDEWIREAQASRSFDKGQAAFDAGRFAEAEQHYAEALQLNPRHKWAAFNRALAIQRQGNALVKANNVEAAIAQYERCFRAYMDAKPLYPDATEFAQDLTKARANIRSRLALAAKTNADWNLVVAAHRRWAEASGGDATAQRELASVRAQQAASAGGSREQLASSVQTLDEIARSDPGNSAAAESRQRAAENLARADRAGDYLRHASAHALDRATAMRQAQAAALQNNSTCFDDVRCRPGQATAAVSAGSGSFFAHRENDRMRSIHAQIDTLEKQRQDLSAGLPAIRDPLQRADRKREIANVEEKIAEQKSDYKQEEAQETRRHGLRRRGSAAAPQAGSSGN